jgi:hypothetical protein
MEFHMLSDFTPHTRLPWMKASQSDKHVTFNAALAKIDMLLCATVTARRNAPPTLLPSEGQCYLLTDLGTADWAGFPPGSLAVFTQGAWSHSLAPIGCILLVQEEARMLVLTEQGWLPLGATTGQIAVNMSLKAGWPIDAVGKGMLLRAGSGGTDAGSVSAKLSRNTSNDSAIVVCETAGSERARFGLLGSDAFKLQVSQNGNAWNEAISASADGTAIQLLNTLSFGKSGSSASLTKSELGALSIGPAGGIEASNPFWRGIHISAPMHSTISGLHFPRLSIFFQSDSLSSPTRFECRFQLGNLIPNLPAYLTLDPGAGGSVVSTGPMRLANYVSTSLPSAATAGAGAIVFITNLQVGLGYSDGTIWRWVTNGLAI